MFLPGMAKRIPKGSTLVFQVHYTTNGTPGTDKSRIGLIFAKEPPKREVRTGMILNPLFAIPPGAANHEIEAEATFTEDVNVWSMHPHMHLRGKDMTYTATYPDGRSEIVLRVPKFDFGWQTDYWLAKPLTLPKGSKIHVSAHYDNSTANRHNPDPKATVRWGDQTWEEMMIGFFTYTVERQGRLELRAVMHACSVRSANADAPLPTADIGRSERTGPTFCTKLLRLLRGARCAQDVAHRVVALVARVLEQRVVRLLRERERRGPRLRPIVGSSTVTS